MSSRKSVSPRAWFPQVKEFFFDDDTFTDDRPRAEAIARELGKLGVTWSCNAKANVPRATLEILRDNGLRLLLVGYETGNQQILNNIKKGMRIDIARRFTKDCHELGITIHGTFILGLPGETKETIEETIRFAGEINPHTIQVSLAAPYPGTYLYRQAVENGWLDTSHAELIDERGVQIAPLHYPHLPILRFSSRSKPSTSASTFSRQKIASLVAEMIKSPQMMRRRLREGVEFFPISAYPRDGGLSQAAAHIVPTRVGNARRLLRRPATGGIQEPAPLNCRIHEFISVSLPAASRTPPEAPDRLPPTISGSTRPSTRRSRRRIGMVS